MAIVKDNPVLENLSGMVGKSLVFRQLGGKTVVQCAPVRVAPYNEAQKLQQGRFKKAMAYARSQMKCPRLKARYTAQAKAKGGTTNPFNMAVAAYFRMQKLKAICTVNMEKSGMVKFDKSYRAVRDTKIYSITGLAIDFCSSPP